MCRYTGYWLNLYITWYKNKLKIKRNIIICCWSCLHLNLPSRTHSRPFVPICTHSHPFVLLLALLSSGLGHAEWDNRGWWWEKVVGWCRYIVGSGRVVRSQTWVGGGDWGPCTLVLIHKNQATTAQFWTCQLVVLPRLWPMFFEKFEIWMPRKLAKTVRIFVEICRTHWKPGVTFWPERIRLLFPTLWSGHEFSQGFVTELMTAP